MHITDKEKKAIHEAMKQIRENRRLQEQELGLYNFKKGNDPVSARMGPLGDHTSNFNDFERNLENVDAAMMPPVEDLAPNLKRGSNIAQRPSQEELPYYAFGNKRMTGALLGINPDGSYRQQTSFGTGRSIGNKGVGMRDARRMRLREQQSRPQSAPVSTPKPGGFNLGDALERGMRAAPKPPGVRRSSDMSNRRPGITALGMNTPAADGSRFNPETGRFPDSAYEMNPEFGQDGYVSFRPALSDRKIRTPKRKR